MAKQLKELTKEELQQHLIVVNSFIRTANTEIEADDKLKKDSKHSTHLNSLKKELIATEELLESKK